MTLRPRRPARPRIRLRQAFEGEDRQQFLVTALFASLIALLVLLLVGAVALAWYNDNLRSVARVGSADILPADVRARAGLLLARIERLEGQVRQAVIDGDIDAQTAAQRHAALQQQQSEVGVTSIEGLIDIIYQSQLAAEMGISVTDADVDQQAVDEFSGPEKRRVLAIVVEPEVADEDTGPTLSEQKAALERAEQAVAQLDSGRAWADVAREFSSHPSRDSGGDYGVVSEIGSSDERWVVELFKLPAGGTTPIVLGDDRSYRIGRVSEILPRQEIPGARVMLFGDVAEDKFRQFLRYEIAAQRLAERVAADAAAGTPEQVRLGNVFIEGLFTGDAEGDEGEIHYGEIVYSPGDDLETAPDLVADDPLWEEARLEAEATLTELRAITDPEQMKTRFAEIATEESDSPVSGDEGGDVPFTTRGLLPTAVGDALFDGEHQPNALIGPVRADAAYYVLLFNERRGSPEERVAEVTRLADAPGADFAEIARQHSDGPDAKDGGEIGWVTREQLNAEISAKVFQLSAGQISEALLLGGGHYIFKVYERAERPLDPDQLSDIRTNAFERWYGPKKDEAEEAGTISRTGELDEDLPAGPDDEFDFGGDEP